ncbi:aldo/keto reductase family oxidoreductase [Vibrio alginolyticus]|uniref:aldo/keto reductase n=1 Tax=Vibrio TaxID=662 RepID=UPI0007AA09CA|nr:MULTISPECIES: aldo/keto reductase family oxidoreductase [Vibrio]ELP3328430.1 aldo/keto reductase family oxidoreductase [Vibrio alginolyticus]KZC44533.1 aldo/keto reductase [Vibrio alginolyticus]MBS9898778.1 aldo/keto reductase family oxidoreductase [Vibrio alginolyticus]MBS9916262.1 aldo/keto reductase family oxidoreductase [Vibrio alginolyticus]MCR9595925.1 aldo/keto reductase family oxidoreductase [Vibrio alginolyticus]
MVAKVVTAPKGPEFSELVQGYWRAVEWGMTAQERLSFLKQHIELGITTVDHADIYGNYECEALFGEALALDKSVREQIQIVTKCDINLCGDKTPERKINHYDTSSAHIYQSVNNSLERLNVDEIDVLLIHRPDVLMDADEVAEAFSELHKVGKVKHFGVSNFTPRQFELLQSRLGKPLVTNQVEINPLSFEVAHDGTLDQMQMLRTRPMAWSCLGGGSIFSGDSEQAVRVRNELEAIREEVGAASIDQVIYAWVRRLPSNPIPIIGSGKIERVQTAVNALNIELTREQWYRVWVASKGHGVP